ncbi:hypothetical protein SAMN05421844_10460 [Bosea robiniae]|uniref:Tyr recombinase domain-containing protein n=2 Tax=Bosea robiniae TaxID=1036780 RepID=A0ABY0P565_9HYPH|nr:hypothetical protein SAMN05421844_10460 [Bosea robiniae]
MAKRVGIEPVEERAYVQDILERVESLAVRLRKTGGKMPLNVMTPSEPSYKAVRRLLELPQGNRLPEPVERRIVELYSEIGVEDAPDPIAKRRLLAWGERARAEGLHVLACSSKPDEPFIPACAELMGVDPHELYHPPNRAILTDLGRELGFEIVSTARELRPIPSVVLVEEWAKREGQKVPQHPSYPGRPYFAVACKQVGISLSSALRPDVRDAIINAGTTLGYVTVIASVEPEAVLLQELREKAIIMRRKEVIGTKSENAQIGNLTWRLKQLAELHPDGELASAKLLLAEAATIKPKDSKFHGEMCVLQRCLDQIERSRSLPDDFCQALSELCKRAKMSYKATSREAGLPPNTVAIWVKGCPDPSRRREVELVERALKAEPNTLVSRMAGISRRPKYVRLCRFPEHIRSNKSLRTRIKRRLDPTDFALPDEGFFARCLEVHREIIAEATKPMAAFVKAPEHALPVLPEQVDRQFAIVCAIADADGPRRRDAMKRYEIYDDGIRWTYSTVEGHHRTLKAFFGYLSRSVEARPAIAESDMSLALALVPELSVDYAMWLPSQRTAIIPGRTVSLTDIAAMRLFGTLLREGGILRKMPQLAKTLSPIPGYLERARIQWIETNWEAACQAAFERYRGMCNSYSDDEFDRSIEIASLMPILNLANPSQAVTHTMLRRLGEQRQLLAKGTITWALAVRNEMYLHTQDQMALRGGTLRQVGTRHFRTVGNGIDLHLPREFFKNRLSEKVWKSGRAWTDFHRTFDDELGGHAVFDLYVNDARPILAGVADSDCGAFFLNYDGTAKQGFSQLATDLSKALLIDWPDADLFWRQQRALRNHDFRHIAATSILRRTDDMRWAARALMDTIETTENTYAFVRAEDENSRFHEIMRGRGEPMV